MVKSIENTSSLTKVTSVNEIIFYNNKNVIHKNLRRFRKKRRLSQEQLAAKLQVMNVNVTQQIISRMEHNTRIVTDYELACLCRALGVTVEEMLADFYEEYPE